MGTVTSLELILESLEHSLKLIAGNVMAEKLPAVKALGSVAQKMLDKLNDAALKAAAALESDSDAAVAKIGSFGEAAKGVMREVHDAVDDAHRALEGGTNGGPLSETK